MHFVSEQPWLIRGMVGAIVGFTVLALTPNIYSLAQNLAPHISGPAASPQTEQKPSEPQNSEGHAGIKLNGVKNATIDENYFGEGITTGIDANNTENFEAHGNVLEPS
jgi:hypothetical protein